MQVILILTSTLFMMILHLSCSFEPHLIAIYGSFMKISLNNSTVKFEKGEKPSKKAHNKKLSLNWK